MSSLASKLPTVLHKKLSAAFNSLFDSGIVDPDASPSVDEARQRALAVMDKAIQLLQDEVIEACRDYAEVSLFVAAYPAFLTRPVPVCRLC